MHVRNVLHEACWRYRTQKFAKNRHLRSITQVCRSVSLQLTHVSTIGKTLVKQQYFVHKFSQYGEPRPTNSWDRFTSLGHPSKFQRASRLAFVTAATSLTGGQPNFARCLAISWTGTLYMHFRELLPPCQNFARCKIHFAIKSCILLYWQRYCTALEQWAWAKFCGVVQGMELRNFYRGRHLYSAERRSRWGSVHILVVNIFSSVNKMMLTSLGEYFCATVLNGWDLHGNSLHSALSHCVYKHIYFTR